MRARDQKKMGKKNTHIEELGYRIRKVDLNFNGQLFFFLTSKTLQRTVQRTHYVGGEWAKGNTQLSAHRQTR